MDPRLKLGLILCVVQFYGFAECITSRVHLYGIILNSFTALIISLLFSCQVVSASLQPHELHVLSFLILHYLPEFAQTHVH